jgi:hypothetical protein
MKDSTVTGAFTMSSSIWIVPRRVSMYAYGVYGGRSTRSDSKNALSWRVGAGRTGAAACLAGLLEQGRGQEPHGPFTVREATLQRWLGLGQRVFGNGGQHGCARRISRVALRARVGRIEPGDAARGLALTDQLGRRGTQREVRRLERRLDALVRIGRAHLDQRTQGRTLDAAHRHPTSALARRRGPGRPAA